MCFGRPLQQSLRPKVLSHRALMAVFAWPPVVAPENVSWPCFMCGSASVNPHVGVCEACLVFNPPRLSTVFCRMISSELCTLLRNSANFEGFAWVHEVARILSTRLGFAVTPHSIIATALVERKRDKPRFNLKVLSGWYQISECNDGSYRARYGEPGQSHDNMCPICLQKDNILLSLRVCRHAVCTQCALQVLRNNKCPECRESLNGSIGNLRANSSRPLTASVLALLGRNLPLGIGHNAGSSRIGHYAGSNDGYSSTSWDE
jgi:hypothetical protein